MRYHSVLILFLINQSILAQDFSGSKVIDSLEDNKFYIVGQLHCNLANNIIEKELLLGLNSKYGVQYNIIEYGHSVALLINEYLNSGQDSFLKYINPHANFSLVKAIKTFNDSLSTDNKIKFYGLDFEGRFEGKFTRHAIQHIVNQTKLSPLSQLFYLMRSIIDAKPPQMQNKIENLRLFLAKNNGECRSLLKDYFLDLLLIANAQYKFSPNRDGTMVDNFYRLYRELLLTNSDPRFFASFGTGHINPSNKRGIAMRLLKDESSPVNQKVSVIGVQYINSGFYKASVEKQTDGNLSYICDNSISDIKQLFEFNQSHSITYISKKTLNLLNCKRDISTFSGLFLIQNYGEAPFCYWQ